MWLPPLNTIAAILNGELTVSGKAWRVGWQAPTPHCTSPLPQLWKCRCFLPSGSRSMFRNHKKTSDCGIWFGDISRISSDVIMSVSAPATDIRLDLSQVCLFYLVSLSYSAQWTSQQIREFLEEMKCFTPCSKFIDMFARLFLFPRHTKLYVCSSLDKLLC